MNYYKLITYAEGGNFETREKLINENTFRQFQEAIANKSEFLILEDRIIRISTIKEIIPANKEVSDYQKQGLKIDGLLEPVEKPKLTGEVKNTKEIIQEKLKEIRFDLEKKGII